MMGGIRAITVVLTNYGALDTSKRASTRIESDESRTWVQGGVFVWNLDNVRKKPTETEPSQISKTVDR